MGALTIYASDVNVFDKESVKLLSELAANLSYGIASLRSRIERNHIEDTLQRVHRGQLMLSNCNDVLLHANNENKLLRDICRIIVDTGNYCMSGVGFSLDDEKRSVNMVAHYGHNDNYLENSNDTWAEDDPCGQGPVGIAIRTRKPYIVRDVATDPAFSLWRKAALERGYTSVIVIPLINNDIVFGVLLVYSSEISLFDIEEVELLSNLANNLAHGIIVLRNEMARKQVEEHLRLSRKRLRNFAARQLAAREEERAIIAREIHDELGQTLTGLKMDLSWLLNRMPRNWKKIPERLQSMISLMDSTVDYVRKLSTKLRPAILDDLGLEAAIESELQIFSERTNCDYTLDLKSGKIGHDRARDTAVLRIFQEALTNVARHAKATELEIVLRTSNSQLILEVKDDGIGIANDKIMSTSSIGLFSMHERAGTFGGRVEIATNIKGGTKVMLKIPLSTHSP